MQTNIPFPDTTYTFADFFSGAGGFSLGMIQAGMKCVSALEFNDDAAWTYWYNLCYSTWSHLWIAPEDTKTMDKVRKKWNGGETSNWLFKKGVPDNWLSVKEPMPCLNLFLMDILKLEPEDWMKLIGVRERDIQVFVGGPPCQGFSTSGRRDILDSRNKLALRMIYYAKVCKPRYVLIENVPGLLTLGKKKGEIESPFVTWIREAFEDAGYVVNYEVHNCADYGVLQNRKRVLFFARRLDVEFEAAFAMYKNLMKNEKPLEPGEFRLYEK
jgi:site-specific DNA-cytosine methylase